MQRDNMLQFLDVFQWKCNCCPLGCADICMFIWVFVLSRDISTKFLTTFSSSIIIVLTSSEI